MTLNQLPSKTRYYGWFYHFDPKQPKNKQWVAGDNMELASSTEQGIKLKIRTAEEECV